MHLLHQYLKPGQTALLIGSETLSRLVDWHDRSTAVLFGDGAGGLLITASCFSCPAVVAAKSASGDGD
ncbi:hypothetical protein WP50_10420 [Lactiplantibacillus plantarum]|nr:hypothetical protein WP50_10420 [Lactiplantibacillus plantarum]